MSEETFRLRLTPLEMIMKRLLTRLATKDPADIFAEPVPLDDVREREREIHLHVIIYQPVAFIIYYYLLFIVRYPII